jgi:WD40 repeat protein
MRYLIASMLTLVPATLAAQPKPELPANPIEVIDLKRKDPVIFEKEILPILEDKCMSCHSGPVKSNGYDMATYEALVKGGKRGTAIHAGRPHDSLLIQLSGRTKEPIMPPIKKTGKDDPLSPQQLALIKLWIEQGARGPTTAIVKKPRDFKLTRLPDSVKPIGAIAVHPDKSVVVAGRGNSLYVYDAAKGELLRTLVNPDIKDEKDRPVGVAHMDIVQAIAFSPDGRYLASSAFQEVLLWDVKTGALQRRIGGFADRVVALDFTKDSKFLATGGGAPTEDGELKIIDPANGSVIVDIKSAHSDTVFGVRFSPDGTKIASCGADKFVKVFEVPSGKFIKPFEGHTHHVMDVGWKGDGKLLASCGADNECKVWDFEKGEKVRDIKAHGKQITRLIFVGATSQFLTASGDTTVKMWNVDNGGQVRNFSGSNDYLYAVGVSPDGAIVATGGQEGIVRIYNGTNGQLIKAIPPPGEEKPAKP